MRRFVCLLLLLGLLGCASSSGPKNPASTPTSADESNPLYAFSLQRQGSLLLQQGRYEEALRKFEQARQIQPTNATVHNMIGLCQLQMGELDRALASFSVALDLVPTFTDARNNRGTTYLALGQYHLAQVDFSGVMSDSTYPHRWEAYYNLGMAYLQQGQLAAAEENLRRAATAPAPVFDAFLRLAEIALQQGSTETAVDLLEEAMLKFADRQEAPLRLGELKCQLGELEAGRTLLDRVAKSSSSSPLAIEARELLGTTCAGP